MEDKRYLFLTCCAQRLSPDRTGYQMEKLFSASLFLFELNFSTKCEKKWHFPSHEWVYCEQSGERGVQGSRLLPEWHPASTKTVKQLKEQGNFRMTVYRIPQAPIDIMIEVQQRHVKRRSPAWPAHWPSASGRSRFKTPVIKYLQANWLKLCAPVKHISSQWRSSH